MTLPYIARVGLGTPGTMDVASGLLIHPHNLPGWHDFPIRDRLCHHCGLPVTYANDANAAAYGEFWVGSGREFHSLVLLTLGTGIGCGIIIGDLTIVGEHYHGGRMRAHDHRLRRRRADVRLRAARASGGVCQRDGGGKANRGRACGRPEELARRARAKQGPR